MNKPRVSILTPIYNSEKYIAETLDSIVNQTFKDWEVILMDGASKDRTLEIARSYAEKHPNIRIFSAPDEGPYDAFHKALPHARGDFISMVCASDGLFDKHWLELCVDAFDKDSEISIVWGVPMDITEDGRIVGPHFAFAHFLKGSGTRSAFLKEAWKRISRPSSLMNSLKKFNVTRVKAAKSILAMQEPPQKQKWFPYWLTTGTVFPDGNMCVAKKVFIECLAPYHKGTRETGDWMSFYFDINARGYLPWCIPLPANFSRKPDENSVSYRVAAYNDEKRAAYFKKIAALRRELKQYPEKIVFRDRSGKVIGRPLL
jgi:glycosyltransferase involved in cell wall biosynthesis